MKLRLSIAALFILAIFTAANATENIGSKKKASQPTKASSAECAPANGLTYLNFNNVNALIETGGNMWQDRPNTASAYEVPANSGQTAIFSGSLWMGGTDANDQLKIAAVTFRQGTNDFWTGPLTTDGSAEITPDVCSEYDRFYHITRQDVITFLAWYNCKETGEGCDAIPEGYKVPRVILEWPAHGDEGLGQDFYLAPFFDRDGDGIYDPENSGDYPYYDLNGDIDCRAVRDIRLFGDDTYWWVFNDKGNIHTETNGASIGMEIRAQAFAFATNDEVNDMTFYNYELINRSTFTLFNTYFGQWVDADLGGAFDDYVGCDVQRGLGYCYNGDDFDQDNGGQKGYGDRPPAVGVDFFEGPYQDNDGVNNAYGIGKDEALNGLGYYNPADARPDSIIDNERFGMRRFVYYNNAGGVNGNPNTALEHYNYLRSVWRNGSKMVFGGQGTPGTAGATTLECDFMFPRDSDPRHWGTQGIDPGFNWTEVTAGNPPGDRRFLQSAGPFTLEPGAINDITVGVVWARAISGSAEASVDKLLQADSKAQALFDNCFDVLDGPDAPDLSGVELDKEIILYLTNKKGLSNNYRKTPGDYNEVDPFIIAPEGEVYDNKYRFQGYQVYQVSSEDVSINELGDLDRARLVFQCDIKDEVADIVNYTFDEELGATVPETMVKNAENDGIKTTFRVTEDQFASGDPKLVNFKTYYFIAIAYAHNEFKPYSETPDGLDGQKLAYLPSRKGVSGGIQSVALVPHKQEPKNGGTIINSNYGDQPRITRIEGQGNGGFNLAFTPA
ncbi:MAG: T9SS C-terminal target domain-containing protein, partial [Vicingaceae bacterium]